MARQLNKLSARAIANLVKPGRHSDGGGLYLSISKDSSTLRRRWTFLYRRRGSSGDEGAGKLREMGLGNLATVSLAKARALATQCRSDLADGLDPIATREARGKLQRGVPTFGKCADDLLATKEAAWRNATHRHQWRRALIEEAAALRSKPVDKVSTEDILGVLQPLWQSKHETATRLRARIEAVIDAARARGHLLPNTANPARWRGHLDKLLPPRRKNKERRHHAAMAFAEVPAFIGRLREREAVAALALEFIILTAARTGEALGARWSEIDMKAKVWTVPAERMKRGVEHRVPLCQRAIEILHAMSKVARGNLVFPAYRSDRPMSNMACSMLLRRLKVETATTHGFRSSFRDWAGELTSFPREVAEAALAHAVGDETERAYRRGDALEKRRKLMDAWAAFLEPKASSHEHHRTSDGSGRYDGVHIDELTPQLGPMKQTVPTTMKPPLISPETEEAAAQRSREFKATYSQRLYENPYWSIPVVLCWIAFRNSSQLEDNDERCRRQIMGARDYQLEPMIENSPEDALLRALRTALRTGRLEAYEDGETLRPEAWAATQARRGRLYPPRPDARMRKENVLLLWPPRNARGAVAEASPRRTAKEVDRFYRDYVAQYKAERRSEEDDLTYVRSRFPGIPRTRLRELRSKHAPDFWKKPGRKKPIPS
jgi:integrase